MLNHLAIIMDGNRRWAQKNKLEVFKGHYNGAQAAQTVIDFCLMQNIPYLSLYLFSLENFKRSEQEKNYLFNLLIQKTEQELDNYIAKGVKIKFIGDSNLFPATVISTCRDIEEKTKHLNKLQLNLLFCYGSRQEIIAGIKEIFNKIKNKEIQETDINEQTFLESLWSKGIPDPDLIIRTGGQQRLSNFLLFQSAYSEIHFLDCLWPDIQISDLQKSIDTFNNSKRNFGV